MRSRSISRSAFAHAACLLGALLVLKGVAADGAWPFFAFDNGLTRIESYEDKARTLKELGYAGIGWRPTRTAEMLQALDAAGLDMVSTYVTISVGATHTGLNDRIAAELRPLKGRDTIVWLMLGRGKGGTDDTAVAIVRDVAELAEELGLQVALYPHTGCYVATVEDALRIVNTVGRPNVGASFNLCHFLKTDSEENLEAVIRKAAPHLRLVSVNGADSGDTKAMSWDRLIQPLGQGSFPVERLLALLEEVGYAGPIGLQCYRVQGDDRENLRQSMDAWVAMTRGTDLEALFAEAATSEFGSSRAALAQLMTLLPRASAEKRRALEAHCAELIRNQAASYRSKLVACQVLSRSAGAARVPALASLLDDEQLSHVACFALETAADPGADQALLEALPRVSPALAIGVVTSVGNRRIPAAVPILAAMLAAETTPADLRDAVLVALARIGSAPAADVLLDEFKRAPSDAVANAGLVCVQRLLEEAEEERALALARTLWENAPTPLARAGALRALAAAGPDDAVRRLGEALGSSDAVVREAAVALVRDLSVPGALDAAVAALPGLPPPVAVQVLHALRERGDAAAWSAATAAAGHESDAVAIAALEALEVLGREQDADWLTAMAIGGTARGAAAAQVLTRLEGEGVGRFLAQALERAEPARQAAICRLLVERHDPADLPLLVGLVTHDNPDVVKLTGRGLAQLGGMNELRALLERLNGTGLSEAVRTAAESAAVAIAKRELGAGDIGVIESGLGAEHTTARTSRLRILGRVGGPAALQALAQACNDPDEDVRDAAVRALCAWPDAIALEPLLHVARTAPGLTHHVLALRACHRLLTSANLTSEQRRQTLETAAEVARRDEERDLFAGTFVDIQDLRVRSKRTYRVHPAGLVPGSIWASDRDYTFTEVPPAILGATYVEGAMNDKAVGGDEPFMRFRLESPAMVYVAYDHRCTDLPDWLMDWEKTGERLKSTSSVSDLILYRKAFPAGEVSLGSPAAPGVFAIYVVAVTPAK